MGNEHSDFKDCNVYQSNTKIPLISINIENDKLNIGDVLVGNIILQPMTSYSITSLEIKITSNEGWILPSLFEDKQTTLKNELLKQDIDLNELFPNENGIALLNPNKYVFPFSFEISRNFIPSFRYPLQNKAAFLYHSLTVEMTSIMGDLWFATIPIAIISLFPQPTSPIIQESTKEVFLMKLFSQGSNKISASFSQTVYKYNDFITFDVFIDNSQCNATVNKIDYVLVRKLVYKLNGAEQFKLGKELNQQCTNVNVKSGEKKTFQCAIQFSNNDKKEFEGTDINMYVPKCDDLNELVTSVATSLIYCEYLLNIYIGYSGMTKNETTPRIIMPIFTGRLKKNNSTDEGKGNLNIPKTIYDDINKFNDEYEILPATNCVEEMMYKHETNQ